MPQHTTDAPKPMVKPEKGGTPKRITGKGSPGGPHTPGEKEKRRRAAERIRNKQGN